MSEVYVMVTICSRKNMPRFVDCYKDYNVEAANISLGRGTASSDVLDLLGLEDDEKGIHMSFVTEDTWKNVKKGLQSKLRNRCARNRNRIYSVAKQYWWQERAGILN